MSQLPIKVQVGIRDSWDNQDAPVQKAIRNLKEVVGVQVSVALDWPLLTTELGSFYSDKAILVLSVAAAVETCLTALTTLADDEANAEWTDIFLERTDGHIRLFLEASKSREIGIAWSNQQGGLVVSLPKGPIQSQSYMLSFFMGNLLKIFDEKEKHSTSSKTESTTADDWADVAVDNKTGNAAVVEIPHRHATQQPPAFDLMPDVEIIPRPEELLLKPPYYLTIRDFNSSSTEVQCSHSPTLQFLSDYLKKWARTNYNHTNKPPLANVQLHQSAFGLGVVYDRLTITAESRYTTQEISPTMILALVEGVLGYKIVSNDGPYWAFRRDVEFRSSRY
ncbi:hypothetical protein F5Y12DRAFT_715422 [Xylaria sp. FL1777]|nr:hypothetical protein F5Y12DRAFT_715422 [Xylaria sp. FL1777]